MKIALAQINTTVGAFAENAAKIREFSRRAAAQGAELVVFPELTIPGYPPMDLVERPSFIARNRATLAELAAFTNTLNVALVVGFAEKNPSDFGKPLFNAAALLAHGEVLSVHYKSLLPTYDVFDEGRHFQPAEHRKLLPFRGRKFGLHICEDAWNNRNFWDTHLYDVDPVVDLAKLGADLLLNISGSPFYRGKGRVRREMMAEYARQFHIPVILVNQVGGNDGLIFDGRSFALNAHGETVVECRAFAEDLVVIDVERLPPPLEIEEPDEIAEIYDALTLGVRDYLAKCGFTRAVVGLSGGIDSAVTAAVAVAALGRENVLGVAMPSRHSSQHSLDDAAALARNLGVAYQVVPIVPAVDAFAHTLAPVFAGRDEDVTEENIQARLRGVTLMAISNKLGHIVLTTGNKSELAVGYCTLYGDMCGGLSVISDVPKTDVYRLAAHINRDAEIIPHNTIAKPPSAELRPGQTDQDSLPPYDVLDAILERYVEQRQSVGEIALAGFERSTVEFVARLVNRSEYKRQQGAPGLKVTPKAFGRGRRIPIAAKIDD